MKKILALVLTLLVMTSLFSITALASESASVIKVQYDSETKTFDNFEDGWNFAMEEANKGKEVYATLLKDWIAEDGQFTDDWINGAGFDYDAIYFADDVNITLDLGGYTIDRGLTLSEQNGEVMFINDDANVTIKNGTITGGYSNNGAGGIHIEGANVSLIDLVFTGNRVHNDDGAAIQHVGGGELYMKNCRFVDNDCKNKGYDIYGTVYLDGVDKVLIEDCYFADNDNIDYGAGIYADNCEDFVIKNSTFENLNAGNSGGAIWVGGYDIDEEGDDVDDGYSKLYIYNCKFNNNTCGNSGGAICTKMAELHVYDTEFKGNYSDWDGGALYFNANMVDQGSILSCFYRCTFDGNSAGESGGAIFCYGSYSMLTKANTYGCEFINNSAGEDGGAVYLDADCSFGVYSDEETGKAGTIKNNSAGKLGGGVFAGKHSPIRLGGEIYASGNVSSAGDDDIYLDAGRRVYIDPITSPEGSVGLRFKSDTGEAFAVINEESTSVNPKVFFDNGGEFDIVSGYYNKYVDNGSGWINVPVKMPALETVKKSVPVGSIFGEGSLTMIVAILALIASGVSIFLIVDMKKKLVTATANNTEENKAEE